jgi:multidrug resistance efflux pump
MTQTDTLEPAAAPAAPESTDRLAAAPATASSNPPAKTSILRGARKWRNRAIVLVMAAAAAFGAVALIDQHAARSAYLDLGNVVLTSQPIEVDSTAPGVVTAVAVHAGDRVVGGQLVGSIDVTTTTAQGKQVVKEKQLLAPSNGVVVDDPMTVGSNLLPGSSFLEMYDPNDLQLVTTVPLSYLPKISPGMTAQLSAPGVSGKITAVLKRAVPRVGSNQSDVPKGSLQLVFIAHDQSQVVKLIPGLRFHGEIDTRTGSGSSDRAQYVESP